MDETFEALTLIQTGRMRRVPFLLFGEKFWRSIINWEALADAGTISEDDLELFRFVETAEEAVELIANWHQPETKRGEIPGRWKQTFASGGESFHPTLRLSGQGQVYPTMISGNLCAGGVLRLRCEVALPSITVMPTPGRLPSWMLSRMSLPGACWA